MQLFPQLKINKKNQLLQDNFKKNLKLENLPE